MTECSLDHQATFTKEYTAQLSIRGIHVLDRLLVLLGSQQTTHPSPLTPSLLFSICDILQHGRAGSSEATEHVNASVLPSVLSKLRDWRLFDAEYRCSSGGIHQLALNLAGVTEVVSASTSSVISRTSHNRLRMTWVGRDSHASQDRGQCLPTPPSPLSRVFDLAQECADALPSQHQRRVDVGYESCQADRLGTPDSEDASTVVSRRRHSGSGFRSGCSACRHPRVSGPSNPPTSLEQRTPFGEVNHFDTHINTSVSSPRQSRLRVTTKKPKRKNKKSLQSSILRGAHVDENEPPVCKPPGDQHGIGVSFPRQRTHSPRISNPFLSRNPLSPVATSVQRRVEPNHLLNHTREGDKRTFSHRVASVDLLSPIANHSRTPTRPSPIDHHPHTPNRAQSSSYTPVNSHGSGNVVGSVPKLSSNVVDISSKRLPSWSQTHRHDPTTATTVIVNPPSALSPTLAKAHSRRRNSQAHSSLCVCSIATMDTAE